jgi:hypothetical protein
MSESVAFSYRNPVALPALRQQSIERVQITEEIRASLAYSLLATLVVFVAVSIVLFLLWWNFKAELEKKT